MTVESLNAVAVGPPSLYIIGRFSMGEILPLSVSVGASVIHMVSAVVRQQPRLLGGRDTRLRRQSARRGRQYWSWGIRATL